MALLAATPVPDAVETRTNATFDALMWALARPGSIQPLPSPDVAHIAEALVDRECRVFCDDAALAARLAAFGARDVPVAQADHAFLSLADGLGLQWLAQVAVGSDLYPDEGATVIAPARFGEGPRLRLTGPGIDGFAVVALGGLAEGLWALRAARCRYPAGFDLFLTDGAQVMGLPRSTAVQVL